MAGHWKVGQVKITGTKVPPFIFSFRRAKERGRRERLGRGGGDDRPLLAESW